MQICCMVKQVDHAYIKCVRLICSMVFAEVVDFFVAWLSCLLACWHFGIVCSIYMEPVIQLMWQNEGACCGVVQRRENFSLY